MAKRCVLVTTFGAAAQHQVSRVQRLEKFDSFVQAWVKRVKSDGRARDSHAGGRLLRCSFGRSSSEGVLGAWHDLPWKMHVVASHVPIVDM